MRGEGSRGIYVSVSVCVGGGSYWKALPLCQMDTFPGSVTICHGKMLVCPYGRQGGEGVDPGTSVAKLSPSTKMCPFVMRRTPSDLEPKLRPEPFLSKERKTRELQSRFGEEVTKSPNRTLLSQVCAKAGS